MKRSDFKGNVWRQLCASAIEQNGGYSRGYHDRYALSWTVGIYWGVPDAEDLVKDGGSGLEALQENYGVTAAQFFETVGDEALREWMDEWNDEHNQSRVWDLVREDMARGVTDADTYRTIRPEIAARYGLPGSEPKLHSGKRYNREHKYREGAWDHIPYFDVRWEFAGRGGKHLCLAEFEGHGLEVRSDDLSADITSDSEAESYSNAWCQKLLAFIHECDLCFTSENVKKEFDYQVNFRVAEELHELYEKAVADAKEEEEAAYWAARDVATVA